MDIRKWLDGAVLPEQPPSPGAPNELPQPKAIETGRRKAPKEKSRRKRARSDSSILDVCTTHRKNSPIGRGADVVGSGEKSGSSDISESLDPSSGSRTSSQHYARKPRRKTQPGRYEPTPKDAKRRGTQVYRHRKDESKKKNHASRRNKAKKQGVGLVQSFHAKNVSQDRLTLKPREKLGLFNKGRVSSPVKGRGLPDLVFSEMKFLQKRKDHPEAVPLAGQQPKKRKKDHAHAKEDEISAYFTTVRPALAEKDVNTQAKEGTQTKRTRHPSEAEQSRERSSVIDNAVSTVEIPGKAPFLGFGSRGPRHESGSYISWSESIRAPSATPVRMQAGSSIERRASQLGSVQDGKDSVVTGGGDMLHSMSPPSVARHLTDESGRFRVSSLTPVNQRISRSHSYPERLDSKLDERTGRRRAMEKAVSHSSMPAVVPVRSERRRGHGRPAQTVDVFEPQSTSFTPELPEIDGNVDDAGDDETNGRIYVNDEPQTSSSLGRLLRQCNSVFNEQRSHAPTHGHDDEPPVQVDTLDTGARDGNSGSYGRIRSLPTVRFSGFDTYHPRVSTYAGPSIYEEQEMRLQQEELEEQEELGELEEELEEEYHGGADILHDSFFMGDALDGHEDMLDDADWQASALETVPLGPDVETSLGGYRQRYEADESEFRAPQRQQAGPRWFWRPHKRY